MLSQTFHETLRSSYAEIFEALKRSDGMSMAELARELGRSYMGLKQHCVKLVELGYLKEWRVPRKREVGRPEKLYQLTAKTDVFFPQVGFEITLGILQGMKDLYGASAPEKVLWRYFEQLQEGWLPKIRGAESLVEKATRLTDLRDQAGWFSRCHYDAEEGFRIEEFHNPMAKLYEQYPTVEPLEVKMLEQLLGTKIRREERDLGKGRARRIYKIHTLGVRGPVGVIRATRALEGEEGDGGDGVF